MALALLPSQGHRILQSATSSYSTSPSAPCMHTDRILIARCKARSGTYSVQATSDLNSLSLGTGNRSCIKGACTIQGRCRSGTATRISRIRTSALPGPLDDLFTGATVAVSGLAILTTLVYRPTSKDAPKDELTRQEDNFGWGVAGFVSFIPIFGFVAWVLPALEISNPSASAKDQSFSSSLYYAYSLLYAAPLIRNGFEFDGYSFLMLALCIAHIQVERIVLTEPVLLDDMAPLTTISTGLKQTLGSAFSFGSSVQKAVEERTATALPGPKDEDPLSIEQLELEAFDQKLRLREPKTREEGRGPSELNQ